MPRGHHEEPRALARRVALERQVSAPTERSWVAGCTSLGPVTLQAFCTTTIAFQPGLAVADRPSDSKLLSETMPCRSAPTLTVGSNSSRGAPNLHDGL